jgi:hypothetical protein
MRQYVNQELNFCLRWFSTCQGIFSDRKLPPQALHHVPSSTPMTDSDMDPNAIPDIAPTITHHGVLTLAEANAQLEALVTPSIYADAAPV